jgi:hypothetical protein
VVLTEKTSSNIKKRTRTTECHLSSHTILRSSRFLVVCSLEQMRLIRRAWLYGIFLVQCLGWQLCGDRSYVYQKRTRTTECHLSSLTILHSVIYPTSFVSTGQPYKNTQNCVKSSKNHPSWPSGNRHTSSRITFLTLTIVGKSRLSPRCLSNFWVSWRPRRVVLWRFYTVLGVFV